MTTTPASLLVVQLDAPNTSRSGDWHYRTFSPGRALARVDGVHVISLDNVHRAKREAMREADVLVLKSVVDPDLLPVLEERRRARRLTVYEISDDAAGVQPWNPVHFFFRDPENLHLWLGLARAADLNEYSAGELARLYGHLVPPGCGRVVMNQLDAMPPPRPAREVTASRPLVIGWGGSSGHLDDMSQVAPRLIAWLRERKDVRLHLMCSDSIWRLFDALPAGRKQRTRTGTLVEYLDFVGALDVGIAPLDDTAFNRSRSDVKFVEYAAHSVAPVLRRLVPYLETARDDDNALLFDDAAGLVRALDALASDPARRARIAASARASVAGRVQDEHAAAHVDFLRDGLAAIGHAPRAEGEVRARFERLAALEGARVDGRHAVLEPTRYELLLHDALVLAQQDGQRAHAGAMLLEAAAREPADHQPHLLRALACAPPDAPSALVEALRREPASVRSHLALGEVLSLVGDAPRALERYLAAARLAPDWEVPWRRASRLLGRMGAKADAQTFTGKADAIVAALAPPMAKAA